MLFNLPNFLTLSRIVVIPLIVGLFYLRGDEARWLALALFILAGVTDYFDGYFARAGRRSRRSAGFSIRSPTSCWSPRSS